MSIEELKEKKVIRDMLLRKTEKASYDYAQECELGAERIAAFEIYENIRNAARVY